MNVKAVAYVPVLVPMPIEPELGEWFEAAMDEIQGQSLSLGPNEWTLESTPVSIAYSTNPELWPELKRVWRKGWSIRTHHFLRFQTDVSSKPLQELSAGQSPELVQELFLSSVASNLAKVVCDYVLAANIAKPGAVHTTRGILLVNGRRAPAAHLPKMYTDLFYMAVRRSAEIGWPAVSTMDVHEAWNWVSGIDGLASGVPRGRAGRAFAALSYLLSGNGSLDLVWALLGLEALYGTGNTGLREQLSEKSSVLLGRPSQHKKEFGRAYDYRSRLLHGDVDVPLAYSPHDALEEFARFHDESIRSGLIAISVLLATLQKMISLSVWDMEFSYDLLKT